MVCRSHLPAVRTFRSSMAVAAMASAAFDFTPEHFAQSDRHRQIEEPMDRRAAKVGVDEQGPQPATGQAGREVAGQRSLSLAGDGARDHHHLMRCRCEPRAPAWSGWRRSIPA